MTDEKLFFTQEQTKGVEEIEVGESCDQSHDVIM